MVWHLSSPLMNSFNKTEAADFSFRQCFLRASLSSVLYRNNVYAVVDPFVIDMLTVLSYGLEYSSLSAYAITTGQKMSIIDIL